GAPRRATRARRPAGARTGAAWPRRPTRGRARCALPPRSTSTSPAWTSPAMPPVAATCSRSTVLSTSIRPTATLSSPPRAGPYSKQGGSDARTNVRRTTARWDHYLPKSPAVRGFRLPVAALRGGALAPPGRSVDAREDVVQRMGVLVLERVDERMADLGGVHGPHPAEQRRPLAGDRDDRAAAVVGARLSPYEAVCLEPVDKAGEAAAADRDHLPGQLAHA